MPKSLTERQAAYRQRLRAKAGEGVEAAVEPQRQATLDKWIAQVVDDARVDSREPAANEMAMLRNLKVRPALTGEAFHDSFSGVINREVGGRGGSLP